MPPFTNRLAKEKSPYLLQHAHNPVDWYPWGVEAFTRARAEDKPIFLSIGYSACHWCHVMERESFENAALARLLNQHFVSIKVDREERPDVDEIYMTAVQMITGSGGWPMSMFLTPDGRPFYGGTYFPPEPRHGRISFGSLLTQLADAYTNRRAEVEESANGIATELKKAARQSPPVPDGSDTPLAANALMESAVADMKSRFDSENGGFGGAPKFPPHHALRLLTLAARQGSDDARAMLTTTLDRMAMGGIYDHIGGGFHRYATDAVWLLPHFEKMLYDNALLARVYAEAFALTDNLAYARIARETCDWMLRDLLDAGGGLYAALDADSEGEEGKYYVWTYREIGDVLGSRSGARFTQTYRFALDGNYRDEATRAATGANIPHLDLGKSNDPLPETLGTATEADLKLLLAARYKRVPPRLDDKVITAWNGLAIGALAVCGRRLNEPRYTAAARRAANFALTVLRTPKGTLLRRYAGGDAGIAGYLDDYALLADGLLDLYETTDENSYLTASRALANAILEKFADPQEAGFFHTSDTHESLIARTKDLFDGALPSPNGVAVRVLARLSHRTDGERFGAAALATLNAYRVLLARAPQGVPTLIEAATDLRLESGIATIPVSLTANGTETILTAPGKKLTLSFSLTVAPHFHVQSQSPTDSSLTPTRATIVSDVPAALGPVRYPLPATTTIGGDTLSIFTGATEWTFPVQISPHAPPGTYQAALEIRCQPCNDRECLLPTTIRATVTIRIIV